MASSSQPPRGRRRSTRPVDAMTGVGRAATRNAVMLTDLGLAAATTIGHRTARMMLAAGNPSVLADPEFTRMVTEKIAAGGAASQAIVRDLLGLYWTTASWAGRQTMLNLRAVSRFGPTFPLAVAMGMGRRWTDLGHRLATDGQKAVGNAVRPAHRKARANAKRLGREFRSGG